MRHRKRGRHFNRKPAHRKAMRRNIVCNLFLHGRIRTTPAKAKDCRGFAEKLITLARENTLANFRRAMALLNDKFIVRRLFQEIGPRYRDRRGGYTRILKLDSGANRLGDNAEQVIFELVTQTEADVAAREEQGRKSRVQERLRRYSDSEEGESPESEKPEDEKPEAEGPADDESETQPESEAAEDKQEEGEEQKKD